jgi:hypothetical protein
MPSAPQDRGVQSATSPARGGATLSQVLASGHLAPRVRRSLAPPPTRVPPVRAAGGLRRCGRRPFRRWLSEVAIRSFVAAPGDSTTSTALLFRLAHRAGYCPNTRPFGPTRRVGASLPLSAQPPHILAGRGVIPQRTARRSRWPRPAGLLTHPSRPWSGAEGPQGHSEPPADPTTLAASLNCSVR